MTTAQLLERARQLTDLLKTTPENTEAAKELSQVQGQIAEALRASMPELPPLELGGAAFDRELMERFQVSQDADRARAIKPSEIMAREKVAAAETQRLATIDQGVARSQDLADSKDWGGPTA
jgi:hypothetical protein